MTTSTAQLSPGTSALTALSEPISTTPSGLLERLSGRGFRLLVLSMYGAGLLLASSGMQRLASLRSNYYMGQVRARAVSPLRYGSELSALNALVAPVAGDVRIIVRADSAGGEASNLCALASAFGRDSRTAWIAVSPDIQSCITEESRRTPIPSNPAAAGELSRARWVILGPSGRVLHSGWDVPEPEAVRETAELFTTSPLTSATP